MSDIDLSDIDDFTTDDSNIMATVGRDAEDVRDLVYTVPDAVAASLPTTVDYQRYASYVKETWHQRGLECTGFALAAIANYIFRSQLDDPDLPSVSRRMLYEMAQVYDGESFETGSTPRGALKGWRNVGVASDEQWPYDPSDEDGSVHGRLTLARLLDARTRPLMRYRSIPDCSKEVVQGALAEGHVLFASSDTHGGWYRLFLKNIEPVIRREAHHKMTGDHAFVIVGYDETGFWVHNSWGPEWGSEGYALLPYDEWEQWKSSAWVIDARMETPRQAVADLAAVDAPSGEAVQATYRDMWPHLLVLRDDGRLASSGLYEMDEGSVKTLLFLFQEYTAGWKRRRLAVLADGGYRTTPTTIDRLTGLRDALLGAEIYPIFIVWETAWFADLQDEVCARAERKISEISAEAGVDVSVNADVISKQAAAESAARRAWALIRERSQLACRPAAGGARLLANSIEFKRNQKPFDLHLVSHGAGDLLLSELIGLLPAPVTSAVTVASASPRRVLGETYGPMLDDGCLQHLTVLTLTDDAERADAVGTVSGSLLNLVSDVLAVEGLKASRAVDTSGERWEWCLQPEPLLGLARHLGGDADRERLDRAGKLSVETVETVEGLGHVDLLFDPGVQARLAERMLEHQTMNWVSRPADGPALPRDPLERAEFLRRSGSTRTSH